MEPKNQHLPKEKFTRSVTFRGLVIVLLTLLLLIPGGMIQSLIRERQERSAETIEKINAKWSNAQTLCGPILCVPYTAQVQESEGKTISRHGTLHITPEELNIDTKLFPEERHYGIYKTILYKSENAVSGEFLIPSLEQTSHLAFDWAHAFIKIGLSDLRGITANVEVEFDGRQYTAEAGGSGDSVMDQMLIVLPEHPENLTAGEPVAFRYNLTLNGSTSIDYIPVGKTTTVHVSGNWAAPGFIGSFTPEYTLTEEGFDARWSILRFNRAIPDTWSDNAVGLTETSFGVGLVDPVDHYQQNMRSAKYAVMFIALTFVVFFFVELLTRKRIHPIQYLLVGIALTLFYSLLLSISEQIGFGGAYLIASAATIALITCYAHSIFRNKTQTGILALMLGLLYVYLYVVLQLEDIALLIGSIGLFLILGIIMYVSRRINWYKPEDKNQEAEEPTEE